jgi:hypothetical protein
MQGDGNLVLYQGNTALWSSGTLGDSGSTATMQTDGNLVVYDNGVAKWSSNTNGFGGSVLKLQDDNNLVIYQGSDPVWDWVSGYIGDSLAPGETISSGQRLIGPGHQYQMVMQGDGNLVLYQGNTSLWSSGTSGDSGSTATMQTDGNLVIYDNGVAKWSSNTAGFGGSFLKLQDDNNLVIYQGGQPVWDWASGYMGNTLGAGGTLSPGQVLIAPGHQYRLIMQGDGNLVLYQGNASLWSSGTSGDSGSTATMQTDGNLVVYDNGVAKWYSNTAGFGGSFLRLQDDNNLVIYQGSTAIWDWQSGKLASGGTGAGGNLRSSIVNLAESQDQYGQKIANNPATTADGGCNPYTGYWESIGASDGTPCSSVGGVPYGNNAWCADFAAWAWKQGGVSFTYGGGGSNINAWSASFYFWGQATGNWHPLSSGYSPQPGDVAVYGNLTEAPGPGHVGIYVSGSASSPTVVNGNWATSWLYPSNDGVIIQGAESSTGVSGGGLDGYVSP